MTPHKAVRKITTLVQAKKLINALSKQLTIAQEALARAEEKLEALKHGGV